MARANCDGRGKRGRGYGSGAPNRTANGRGLASLVLTSNADSRI